MTLLCEVQVLAKEKSFILYLWLCFFCDVRGETEKRSSSKSYNRVQPHGRITIREIKSSFTRRLNTTGNLRVM